MRAPGRAAPDARATPPLLRPLLVLVLLAVAYVSAAAGLLWWSTAPLAVGWQPTVVLTGSMDPALRPGDVVLIGPAEPGAATLPPNRIALVDDPSQETGTYLHRVVRYDDDGNAVTRGDANQSEDVQPVTADRVLGQVRLVVPVIGMPTVWLHRGDVVPLVVVTLGSWAAVMLTAQAVRWVRREGRVARHRAEGVRRARRAVPLAAGCAALAVGTTLTPLDSATVAPWTATHVSTGNTIATGTWPLVSTTYRNAVAADLPMGTWRLDETSGTTAYAATGYPNGSYSGSPGLGGTGAMEGSTSPSFDGWNDQVTFADHGDYDFNATTPFSLEAWVYRNSSSAGWPRIIAKTQWPADGVRGWGLLLNGSTGAVVFERSAAGGSTTLTSTVNLSLSTWHHVVATFDGGTMRIYIDGQARGSTWSGISILDTTAGVTFGAVNNTDWLNGRIDEVAIYGNKALSADRVLAHYQAARP